MTNKDNPGDAFLDRCERRRVGLLIALGIGSVLVYTRPRFLAWLPIPSISDLTPAFALGTPQTDRPIAMLLLLFSVAFVLYLMALVTAVRSQWSRAIFVTTLVGAIAFRVALLSTDPIQEIDIYRYMWDGAVSAAGVSPFRYAPQIVKSANAGDELTGDLARLVSLRDSQPQMHQILDRIHYGQVSTVYPPVSQQLFKLVHQLTPQSATVSQRVLWMKSCFVICDLLTLLVVFAILHATSYPIGWAVSYGWCPLVVKEFANSGHLDSLAILLTMTAVYLAARLVKRSNDRPEINWALFVSSIAILALAVGAKIYPVVLSPWLIALGTRRLRVSALAAGIPVLLIATALVMKPMLFRSDPPNSQGSQASEQVVAEPTAGLVTFVRYWEMNDFLFLITVENLKPVTDGPQPWFAIVPDSIRKSIAGAVEKITGLDQIQAAFLLSRAITACVFLMIVSYLLWTVRGSDDPLRWLNRAFLTVAWFWLLCPTQNPWYWIWALPLIPFSVARSWLLMSGLVMIYYLRFLFQYQYQGQAVGGTEYVAATYFDFVVTWFEFGPWFILLAAESFMLDRKKIAI